MSTEAGMYVHMCARMCVCVCLSFCLLHIECQNTHSASNCKWGPQNIKGPLRRAFFFFLKVDVKIGFRLGLEQGLESGVHWEELGNALFL